MNRRSFLKWLGFAPVAAAVAKEAAAQPAEAVDPERSVPIDELRCDTNPALSARVWSCGTPGCSIAIEHPPHESPVEISAHDGVQLHSPDWANELRHVVRVRTGHGVPDTVGHSVIAQPGICVYTYLAAERIAAGKLVFLRPDGMAVCKFDNPFNVAVGVATADSFFEPAPKPRPYDDYEADYDGTGGWDA